jgi:hypothetical protein
MRANRPRELKAAEIRRKRALLAAASSAGS